MATSDTPPDPDTDEDISTPEDAHEHAQETGSIFDGEHLAVDQARRQRRPTVK